MAISGLIAIGYLAGTSRIDLSSGLADWPYYGRDQQGTRYAPLDQINRDNIAELQRRLHGQEADISSSSSVE